MSDVYLPGLRMLNYAAKRDARMTPTERVIDARDTYGAALVIVRPGEEPDGAVDGVEVLRAWYVPAGYVYYQQRRTAAPAAPMEQGVLL